MYAPHVDAEAAEGRDRGVEVVSQADINVANLVLVDDLFAPLCEGLEEDLDGHQQSCHGGLDGGL